MTNDSGSRSALVRIGLLGCGNVGAALTTIIDRDADTIAARTGVRLAVTQIAVRDVTRERAGVRDAGRFTDDDLGLVTNPEIDVVVELIGGIDPARLLISAALGAGKPVVTANKELLAVDGGALLGEAGRAGRQLLFEAAVGGAIPLIRALSVSLAGEPVQRVMGIVNGTTNYILSRMTDAAISYDDALAEAGRLGYAEADPTADVGGFDAAAKAAILASLAFNAEVVSNDVFRQGIERVELADIEFARRIGYSVKLLAIAERSDDAIAVRVHPAMLPMDHPLASVHGAFNAVFIEGEHSGELMLYGKGAGGQATASAVLGDVLDAARGLAGDRLIAAPLRHRVAIRPIDELRAQYYVTVDVADRPGVLAAVATVFGKHGVSIRLMEQVGLSSEARLVFITHMALERAVQATLTDLSELEVVERIGGLLRVIGAEE